MLFDTTKKGYHDWVYLLLSVLFAWKSINFHTCCSYFFLSLRQSDDTMRAVAPSIHFNSFFLLTEICRLFSTNFQCCFTIHVTRHKIDNPRFDFHFQCFFFSNLSKMLRGRSKNVSQNFMTLPSSVESTLQENFPHLPFVHRFLKFPSKRKLKTFYKFS